MSASFSKPEDDLLSIQIAIELDKGCCVKEIAETFGVPEKFVKKMAKSLAAEIPSSPMKKQQRYTENEKILLAERIGAGEELEDVAVEAGVAQSTLKRWCKKLGISIPRQLEQLNKTEQKEIREMLETQDPQEVCLAYNISLATLEALSEPEYRKLDSESLSFIYELLKEQPRTSARKLSGIASQAGLDIPESAISSYKKRLQSLNIV